MSRRPGISIQPDLVTVLRTSIDTPQPGQLNAVPSLTVLHHAQV